MATNNWTAPRYLDGYVLAVPKKNLSAYRRMAQAAATVWWKHGALEYIEAVGDDLNPKWAGIKFPRTVRTKRGETVIFSFIVFKSRAHRDSVLTEGEREREGDERPVHGRVEGQADALRHEAHGVRRIQGAG